MKNDPMPSSFEKSKAVDRAKIKELLEFDEETTKSLLAELVELFEENAPQRIRKMNLALSQNDLETLRREAHTLKSSAGNLGAHFVQSSSSEIEELVTEERIQGMSDRIGALEKQVSEAIAELQQIVRGVET